MVKKIVCFDKIHILLLLGVSLKNKGEDCEPGCECFHLLYQCIGGGQGGQFGAVKTSLCLEW